MEFAGLTYRPIFGNGKELVELPLKLLVIGDFTRRPEDVRLEDRNTIYIDKDNFNEVMAHHKLSLTIQVENYLPISKKNDLDLNLNFSSLSDFEPDSIVMQAPELIDFIKRFNGRQPTDEGSDVLSKQLDAILHHYDFQQLEAAWRGLKFLVDRTDFNENIEIALLNVSKADLVEDFNDNLDICKSGLFRKVYTEEYGMFGGKPFGAIIAKYEFGFKPQDIKLLRYIAIVAAFSHCPFIASVGSEFFGIDDFNDLQKIIDLELCLDAPKYNSWQAFRKSDDACYVALAMPRFLLRLPYGPENYPVKAFNFNENVSGSHEHYLWGNAAFAFASNLTRSFSMFRWCTSIIGPSGGGIVENLPLHQFSSMGVTQMKGSTEVHISYRREYELSEQGFMALTMQKESDNACFFSANSIQKPRQFESKNDTTDYMLGTQLPYLMLICRLAHYLKIIHRDYIGTWKERHDIEKLLNNWIGRYVESYIDDSPKLFRRAKIVIKDSEDERYRYLFLLKVNPRIRYMGEHFTLSLTGILD